MSANSPSAHVETNLGLATVAFAIVLLAIIVPLLRELGYDTFDLEMLFWSASACCLAVACGWLDTEVPRLGAILFAILIYAIVDLFFLESGILGLAALACCLLLSLLPTYSTFRLASVVFCLIFFATSFFSSETGLFQSIKGSGDGAQDSNRPIGRHQLRPIVHIVLDEFGSRLSVSRSAPLRALSAALEQDYLNRGFAVFPATRATSGSSAISLSELVGPPGRRYESEKRLKSQHKEHLFRVPENFYFKELKKLGYRITVVQSSHLNFCGKEVDQCLTYKRAEFMDAARRYDKEPSERLRAAGWAMHAAFSSRTERWGIAIYGYGVQGLAMLGVPGMEPGTLRDEKIWSPARMSLHALDCLEANFAAPKTGHVYFAHILLPHFPFVLDRDCKRRPPREWRWPLWAWEATVAGRRLDGIYAAYGEQLRCTHSHVMRLIDTMTKSVAGPEAVFIIHGDHGPRIFKKIGHVDRTNETEEILSDGLDTFFAVKAAGLPPGINERSASLPVRLHKIFENYLSSELLK